ncbi:MAG: hypothetical protein V3S71_05830, partial [Acidobacteriota bacterium]
ENGLHFGALVQCDASDHDWFGRGGRACNKLGIEMITAHSPQAKGRIERCYGVYQDRFAKEIRLEKLSNHNGVNALLKAFDEEMNRRFAIEPAAAKDFHRRIPEGIDPPTRSSGRPTGRPSESSSVG